MKAHSHTIRVENRSLLSYRSFLLFIVVMVGLLAVPGFAQTSQWRIDSGHSFARLYVGSPHDPYSFSPGVARVSGGLTLNAADPSQTALSFRMYPADDAANASAPATVEISFESKQTVRMNDGRQVVAGEMVLKTHKRQIASAEPNEAYAGLVYGDTTTEVARQNIYFVLPANPDANGKGSVSVSTVIWHERFPQLLGAIMTADWPVYVQDKICPTPASAGEDYAGSPCTGKVIAGKNRVAPSSIGEDYYGVSVMPPTGNDVTIEMQLATVREGSGDEAAGK